MKVASPTCAIVCPLVLLLVAVALRSTAYVVAFHTSFTFVSRRPRTLRCLRPVLVVVAAVDSLNSFPHDENDDDDDEIAGDVVPEVLWILHEERPYLPVEVLEQMCLRNKLLREEGKIWRVAGSIKVAENHDVAENVADNIDGSSSGDLGIVATFDDKFESSFNEDLWTWNDFGNPEENGNTLPPFTGSTRRKLKIVPMKLRPIDVETLVAELIECGFTDDDLCYMFTVNPYLISSTRAKRNFIYLVKFGLEEDWLRKVGRGFSSLFQRDVPGKLRLLSLMFDKESLLNLLRSSQMRILSYDIGRKLDYLRALGYGEDDIWRLCKRGGNVFGMDLRKRFKRLEEVGFRDAVKLVKRYPQLLALRTKTIEQFVEAGLGLSFEDVVKMAEKCPSILGLNATRAVEQLEGILPPGPRRREKVGTLVNAFPQALTYRVDDRVQRLATLMAAEPSPQHLNNARVLLGNMFVRYPPILGYDLCSRVALLEEAGIPCSDALRALPTFPQLVSYNAKSRVQKLKDAGLSPPLCSSEKLGKLIGSFPPLIGYDIENKLSELQEGIQVNRTQALEMIVKYPRILGVNAEKTVRPAAEFFLRHNVTTSYLADHPRVLTRNVNKCLQPRADRLEEIGRGWTPTTLVSLSKKGFEARYGRLGDPAPPLSDYRRQDYNKSIRTRPKTRKRVGAQRSKTA